METWPVSLLPKTLTILQSSSVEKVISQPGLLPLASNVFGQGALKPDAEAVWRFGETWGGWFSLAADWGDLTIRTSGAWSASVMHYERGNAKGALAYRKREERDREKEIKRGLRVQKTSQPWRDKLSGRGVVDTVRLHLTLLICWFWAWIQSVFWGSTNEFKRVMWKNFDWL